MKYIKYYNESSDSFIKFESIDKDFILNEIDLILLSLPDDF